MDEELFIKAVTRFACGVLMLGMLLFLPAGTFAYRQGWLLMSILFVPMFIAGLILMKKNPDLLRKRLNVKEEQDEQKNVILLSGLMFLAAFFIAGLNFRFGWIRLPLWVSYAAAVLFLLAYALYAEVLHENVYLSRTVEVQENHKVVDTGLYGIVRHPMYMSSCPCRWCWVRQSRSGSCFSTFRSSQSGSETKKRSLKTDWTDTGIIRSRFDIRSFRISGNSKNGNNGFSVFPRKAFLFRIYRRLLVPGQRGLIAAMDPEMMIRTGEFMRSMKKAA